MPPPSPPPPPPPPPSPSPLPRTGRAPAAGPLTADRVRSTFIEFFASKPTAGRGHAFWPSSPVVPHDDPTLLFTNAGMNQFKPIFLETAAPGSELARLERAVNTQKCIRAGGKHNDLDDVGKDTYHHTFFEMLGNWSFGDYFKKEAIDWAWELLTTVYGIDGDRLYATYFGGDERAGLPADEEARSLWLRYLPPERVLPFGMKDNFWEMGETGPCGPCSEIHYDRIGGRGNGAAAMVNRGDPDVIEIWNLVFIQFNRESAEKLHPLPAKHVDTGMGLERLTSVLQDVRSNYDTDLFTPIFAAIQKATGARPYAGKLGAADADQADTAYRVIADHLRCLTFAITDGATPNNEGRGYVLRRILRRAVRYGRQMLGAKAGFFSDLVPTVVELMGDAFPELRKDPERVRRIIREEEESFARTLDRGMAEFDRANMFALRDAILKSRPRWKWVGTEGGSDLGEWLGEIRFVNDTGDEVSIQVPRRVGDLRNALVLDDISISGDDAFQLYDTFGFPIDLTVLMAEERGLTVDVAGFERCMEEQRERSRAGSKFAGGEEGELPPPPPEVIGQLESLGIRPTDDSLKFTPKTIHATIKAIWNGQHLEQRVRASDSGTRPVALILDKTCFYAEMGGQAGDTGRIVQPRGHAVELRVETTRAFGGYVLHIGHVARGELAVGDDVQLSVDPHRRSAIGANHTATHLLNLALREALGEGVDQKGSLVAHDRLRFDFSHGKPVTPEELAAVEGAVRERVSRNLAVYAEAAPLNIARQITGLRAVFGEVYPDPVRVVSIGAPISELLDNPADDRWRGYSVEFCGGTHVRASGEVGPFAITSEEAVAKGVRRVVCLTGVAASAAISAADTLAGRIAAAESLGGDALAREVVEVGAEIDQLTMPAARKHGLRERLGELHERVKKAQKEQQAARARDAAAIARQIGEAAAGSLEEIVVNTIEVGSDRKALQAALDTVRQMCPAAAVMLISPDHEDDKLAIMAGVPPLLIKRGLRAGDWVRAAAEACGGKGGGKPESAQGGGSGVANTRTVVRAATAHAAGVLMG